MPDRFLGQTIGKYRVTRLLGTGAFAWVYEAVDQDLEIPVALKVLRPEFAGQEQAEVRFRREAATAARLRHPNIVTVRDVGQINGVAFVAMDLHPLTLGRRLNLMGRLPETEVVRLGLGIAAALATAHASGVIHRDIKPDNILLDADGEPVVGDFGLARALAGTTSVSATNQVLGTPQYFSPEQARGQELDGRSDLYALGVTLYRAATGVVPFAGDDWYTIARQHIETPPVPPRDLVPELTPEFDAVVLRLLAKEPGARFDNAVLAVDALAALPTAPSGTQTLPRLASQTIEAFLRPSRRARRDVGTVLLLAVAAGLGWYWWHSATAADASVAGVVATDTAGHNATSTRPNTDSALPPTPGSVPGSAVGDSVAKPQNPATAPVTRPPRTKTVVAALDVRTDDSADVYVDGRFVGRGDWAGDVPLSDRVQLRTALADAPPQCRTAERDTALTSLRAGQRLTVELPVRTCVVVRYSVQPRDARVLFQSLEGGPNVETRADSAASVLVPIGRYLLRVSTPLCTTFSDTLKVERGVDNPVKPIRLFCGSE